jgi:hypothetical protein
MYTQFGLDWVEENSMKTVIARHFPQLAPFFRNRLRFIPWTPGQVKEWPLVGRRAIFS